MSDFIDPSSVLPLNSHVACLLTFFSQNQPVVRHAFQHKKEVCITAGATGYY